MKQNLLLMVGTTFVLVLTWYMNNNLLEKKNFVISKKIAALNLAVISLWSFSVALGSVAIFNIYIYPFTSHYHLWIIDAKIYQQIVFLFIYWLLVSLVFSRFFYWLFYLVRKGLNSLAAKRVNRVNNNELSLQ